MHSAVHGAGWAVLRCSARHGGVVRHGVAGSVRKKNRGGAEATQAGMGWPAGLGWPGEAGLLQQLGHEGFRPKGSLRK
jgi:hypothetical protein